MSVRPSPSLIGADHVVLSKEELVKFDNVQSRYTLDKAIHVRYILGSFVHAFPGDWIGLFATEWQTARHPLLFQRAAPRPKRKNKKPSLKRTVVFSANNLREAVTCETQSYQFAYVTEEGDVIGVSNPFVFQRANDISRYDAEEVNSVMLTKRSEDSLLVHHHGSPADSDISIISPGRDLPDSVRSESPVLVTCSSDNNIDYEWESIQTFDPEELSTTSLSDDSSDIEVLSTSPSKDNKLESPVKTFERELEKGSNQPVEQQLEEQIELLIQETKDFGSTAKQAHQASSVPSVDLCSTFENVSSITKNPVSDEIVKDYVTLCDFSETQLSWQLAVKGSTPITPENHGNSSTATTVVAQKKLQNTKTLCQTGANAFMQKSGQRRTQLSSSIKKLKKERLQFVEKENRRSRQKEKSICQNAVLKKDTKEDDCIGKRKSDDMLFSNAKTITEKKEEGIPNKLPNTSPCSEMNVPDARENKVMTGNGNDKKEMIPEEANFHRDCFNYDLSTTVQSNYDKALNADCPSPSSLTAQLKKYCMRSETKNTDAHTCAVSKIKQRRRCLKKKKKKGRITDVVSTDKDRGQDVGSATMKLESPTSNLKSVVSEIHASSLEIERENVDPNQQLKVFLVGCTDKDGVAHLCDSRTADEKKKMECIRQRYIKKAAIVINNKLKKTTKAKLKRQKMVPIAKHVASRIADQIHLDFLTQQEVKDPDPSSVEGEKDERCNRNIDQLPDMRRESTTLSREQDERTAAFLEGRSSHVPSIISENQSLSSLFKVWDPLLPCSQQTRRPRVPGYLLDKMDALPVTKNGKSLYDWHRAKLHHKVDLVKTQDSLKASGQMTTVDTHKASMDSFLSPTGVLDSKMNKRSDDASAASTCVNESYANVVKATGSLMNSVDASTSADTNVTVASTDDDIISGGERKNGHTVIGNSNGIDITKLTNYTPMDEQNISTSLPKPFTECALDVQVSLLRSLDQKQRSRFKRNHLCPSRAHKIDSHKLRVKRLRKDMKLARQKKQAFKFAFAEPFLNRDNEANMRNVEQEPVPCFDIARFPFEKDAHTLNWPLPANFTPVSKLCLEDTICRLPEDRHTFLPMPVSMLGIEGNDIITNAQETMGASFDVAVDEVTEEGKSLNMAVTSSRIENQKLRQDATLMSQQPGHIENELILAKSERKHLKSYNRKIKFRKSIGTTTGRKDATALAKSHIESLKSQLKKNDREAACLQNEVNTLREQLKIENEARIKNSSNGELRKETAHMETVGHRNEVGESKRSENEKEWDLSEPVRKKRKREDDMEMENKKTLHSEKAEPKDSLQQAFLHENYFLKTKASRLYPDIEKEICCLNGTQPLLEASSGDPKNNRNAMELNDILKAFKPSTANSAENHYSPKVKGLMCPDYVADLQRPDLTRCHAHTSSSTPLPVKAGITQITTNSHPMPDQYPTHSFPVLNSPPFSANFTKKFNTETNCCCHGTPVHFTTSLTPQGNSPNAHINTEAPYYDAVQGMRHYLSGFATETTRPSSRRRDIYPHKFACKPSPKHACPHAPWQPKRVNHTIRHQGYSPNNLSQADMDPQKWQFKRISRPQSLGKLDYMSPDWFQNEPFPSSRNRNIYPLPPKETEHVGYLQEMHHYKPPQIAPGGNSFQHQPALMQNLSAYPYPPNVPNGVLNTSIHRQRLDFQHTTEVNACRRRYPVFDVPSETHPYQQQNLPNRPHVINHAHCTPPWARGVTEETVQEASVFPQTNDNAFQWHLSPSACEMQTPIVASPKTLSFSTHYVPGGPCSTSQGNNAYSSCHSHFDPSYCTEDHVANENQFRY